MHEIYLEQDVGSSRKSLNALDISLETSKERRLDLFLFRFIGIIRGNKLLFGKYLSLLRLAILVKP